MDSEEIRITFQPSGRSVYVLPGTSLLEAGALAGVILQTPCGGRGTCGKCRVKIVRGAPPPPAAPSPLSAREKEAGWRLACQCRAGRELVVEVPAESTFESPHQILVSDTGAKGRFDPTARKMRFRLNPPAQDDERSDLARLCDAVGRDVEIGYDLKRALPGLLRAHNWSGTAVLSGRELIGLEAGDTTARVFGAAFDMGTTTVVGTLFSLADGRECGVASRVNPQVPFGDDVLSRIRRVREEHSALAQLQELIVEAINGILETLCEEAGVSPADVYDVSAAGNSTMQQILCGLDPSALGEVPFVQVFDRAQAFPAARLGLKTNPGARLYVFPQIGGFVGGDTVAGMVAARLDRWDRPVLFVDIGTNGEIVVARDGEMLAASTAAGPAFEGARIRQGMRAAAGAIEKVIVGDDVVLNVIGNVKPAGLCGTALIDAAAGLLRRGILDATGRILSAEEAPAGLPAALRARLVAEDGATRFVLVRAEHSATGQDISLWPRDVRELQLAAGAIRAGINLLLKRAGLTPGDLGAVLLAGAFGNFIRRSNARRIGMLPQIPCDRIRFIGNAASLGAKLVLLSADERRYASEMRDRTRHVDLSREPGFQSEFAEAMLYPEADFDHCGEE
ncbi:MAG: DUF4445 domain-containing protein [Lentisphaerae bacterium]|nr:DUF4445 domain-containing protein [Lentisphaerota bacterium]